LFGNQPGKLADVKTSKAQKMMGGAAAGGGKGGKGNEDGYDDIEATAELAVRQTHLAFYEEQMEAWTGAIAAAREKCAAVMDDVQVTPYQALI